MVSLQGEYGGPTRADRSLTLALMGSDDLNLRVLAASSSDPKERDAATKVLRLLRRGRHWVLVVLLLGNVVSIAATNHADIRLSTSLFLFSWMPCSVVALLLSSCPRS